MVTWRALDEADKDRDSLAISLIISNFFFFNSPNPARNCDNRVDIPLLWPILSTDQAHFGSFYKVSDHYKQTKERMNKKKTDQWWSGSHPCLKPSEWANCSLSISNQLLGSLFLKSPVLLISGSIQVCFTNVPKLQTKPFSLQITLSIQNQITGTQKRCHASLIFI